MKPRDRILHALHHEEPDRVPTGENGIDYALAEQLRGGTTLANSRERGRLLVAAMDEVPLRPALTSHLPPHGAADGTSVGPDNIGGQRTRPFFDAKKRPSLDADIGAHRKYPVCPRSSRPHES